MTKTHNDLDAILQLLQEKEKDLELSAQIGQSLLERNKHLMYKTETMEKFLGESFDKEDQLRHEIVMKNDLLQKFLKDQEDLCYDPYKENRSEDDFRSSDGSYKDDSLIPLEEKCHLLEQQNSHLILEALQLKEETATEEQKERQLVADCVCQMIEAKDQITALTDEISNKAEDNIRQQDEISQLISTVVDLQRRHRQLSSNNEELQSLLNASQSGQDELQSKVADLQEKYHECFDILMENQQEMKSLNKKLDTSNPQPSASASPLHETTRDSIALEIEESVKRDLANIHEKRLNLARVLQTVRNINMARGKKPKKPAGQHRLRGTAVEQGAGFNFTPAPELTSSSSDPSLESLDDGRASASDFDSRYSYGRRSFRKPEKLQIVKPMKGSVTLQQWKKLASPTMNLAENRPGVHVKGELQQATGSKLPKEQSDVSDVSDVDTEDDEDNGPIQMRIRSRPEEIAPSHGEESTKSCPMKEPPRMPRTLGLTSLVSEHGIHAGTRRGSASGSILAQLLNSPSSTAPERSSVGQVLASVLQKASKQASAKEPKRAESLRSLANYFSEKERAAVGAQDDMIPEDENLAESPPISPPELPSPSAPVRMTGSIFSRILGSSSMNVSIPPPRSITTMANSSSNVTTTTSIPLLARPGFGRTSSGTNLKGLLNAGMSFTMSDKRHSLDASDMLKGDSYQPNLHTDVTAGSLPTLRRRASSGDLEKMASGSSDQGPDLYNAGFGSRLFRSSSIGNLNDLSQMTQPNSSPGTSPTTGTGFFGRLRRRPSLGSLTDLIQKSNIGAVPIPGGPKIQRSSSIDSGVTFRPSRSPPSPSQFENGSSFFANTPAAQEPASISTVGGNSTSRLFSGPRLSSLAGVRGLWSRGPVAGPSGGTPSPAPVASGVSRSEERLETINKALTFEDFGGLGLMSFFGGNTQRPRPPK